MSTSARRQFIVNGSAALAALAVFQSCFAQACDLRAAIRRSSLTATVRAWARRIMSKSRAVKFALAFGFMSVTFAPSALAEGDIVAGEKLFLRKCFGCHVVPAGATAKGPTLRGVVGRPVASVEGFAFSDGLRAFRATGAVWDEATLDKLLQDTIGFVRGMRMTMTPISRDTDRADLIAFLKSNK